MKPEFGTAQLNQRAESLAPGAADANSLIDTTYPERHMEEPSDPELESSRRKLRNMIIMVNAVVWIVLIVAIRLIFF